MQAHTRSDGTVEGKASSSARKKTVSRLELEPADNGGAVVRCLYKNAEGGGPGTYHEPTVQAFASMGDAVAAIPKVMGMATEAEKDEDDT